MGRSCKICWVILAVFFVGNIIVLGLWLANSGDSNEAGGLKSANQEKVKKQWKQQFMKKLDLDTMQFNEFERLRGEHLSQIFTYQKQIDSLKEVLMNQTFTGEADTFVVDESIDKIAELQKNIEYLNFTHYRKIRKVCKSEEQKQKLDHTFRHWMEKPRGRHRRGKGPR
nr:hypothetical protein [uncultured Carboxylicivirga sp.]